MNREELLRCYPAERERLRASLSRLVGPSDAEDLANDTLLRALAAIDDFRGEAALSTWLHRIGTNLAYDLLRKRNKSPVLSMDDGIDVPEAIDEAADAGKLEQRQMSECVQKLFAELPSQHREVLAKADMLDQTVPEIARDAGITTGNAKIRLHRARRAMKEVLECHCDLEYQDSGVLGCQPKAANSPISVSFSVPVSSKRGTDPVRHKEKQDA